MLLAVCAGSSTRAETWRYAESPHFEVYSLARAGESRELLEHLELFRATFAEQLGLPMWRGPRTTVVLFRHHQDFDAYKPRVKGKPGRWRTTASLEKTRCHVAPCGISPRGARLSLLGRFIACLKKILVSA